MDVRFIAYNKNSNNNNNNNSMGPFAGLTARASAGKREQGHGVCTRELASAPCACPRALVVVRDVLQDELQGQQLQDELPRQQLLAGHENSGRLQGSGCGCAHICGQTVSPYTTPPQPSLVLRDTLCSCEAQGMRPTFQGKIPFHLSRMRVERLVCTGSDGAQKVVGAEVRGWGVNPAT